MEYPRFWKMLSAFIIASLLVSTIPPFAQPVQAVNAAETSAVDSTRGVAHTDARVLNALPVESSTPPHVSPPAASTTSAATIAPAPVNTFPTMFMIPTIHQNGSTNPGGVWTYSSAGWELRNGRVNGQATSTSLPAFKYWYWLAADPQNRDRWLLLGNSTSTNNTFYWNRTLNIVTMYDGVTPPLWYTEDAGYHWYPVILRDDVKDFIMMPGDDATYRIEQVEFALDNINEVKWFISANRSAEQGNWKYARSLIWRGQDLDSQEPIVNPYPSPDIFLTPGLNGDIALGRGNGGGVARHGYLPATSAIAVVHPELFPIHNFWVDRLPGDSPIVVGLDVGNTGGDDGIYITPDYRTTSYNKELNKISIGTTMSVATHGVYVGGRGNGLKQYTNITDTVVLSSTVTATDRTILAVRADRQERRTVAANASDRVYVTFDGITWETITVPSNVPRGMFARRIEVLAPKQPLPDSQNWTNGLCQCDGQEDTPYPVNTRSGAFWTRELDLAWPDGPTWSRTYVSQTPITMTSVLGQGWQHSYATRVLLPTPEPGYVVVQSPQGNLWRYKALSTGGYQAAPGIYSDLVRGSGVYTVTLRDQQQWIFNDTTGQLIKMRDAQGRYTELTYNGSGQLQTISDVLYPSRTLTVTHDLNGRIAQVTDGTRSVNYGYDSSGDLTSFTDVMGRTTTYTYLAGSGGASTHLLTHITNPMGQVVEQMTYSGTTPASKVTHQTLLDGQQITFSYAAYTTTVTTTTPGGATYVQEYIYGADNSLTGVRVNGQPVQGIYHDTSFSPSRVVDGNGNVTRTGYTSQGLPRNHINALGQATSFKYDQRNNPIEIRDAQNVVTRFRYDSFNNVISQTIGITTSIPLGFTTLYTYTAQQKLLETSSQDGVVTRYAYDTYGRVTSLISAYGTPLAQTTTYEYDTLGRQIATTIGVGTSASRRDIVEYNPDNTIHRTIQNYHAPGIYNPNQADRNITTTYGYDALGRTVAVTDTLGYVSLSHYDTNGRVDWSMRNARDVSYDAYGQPIYQTYSASNPDRNVATLYGYDGFGRTTFITETGLLTGTFNLSTLQFSHTDTRTTRYEYDSLSRPITVTLNYRAGLPSTADTNIKLYTRYDGAGNVITQTDALGRWFITEYDALNRPIKVIANHADGNPTTSPADADIITVYEYNALGQLKREISNYIDGVFSILEPTNDRITQYDYNALGQVITTTLNLDPATLGTRADTNLVTTSRFDPTTLRLIGSQDTLGKWTAYQYDLLGRVTTTIQNCTGVAAPASCGLEMTDANIVTETEYDELGRPHLTTDPLNVATKHYYDGLGRVFQTVRNWKPSSPNSADTNVSVSATFDGLGRAIATVDQLDEASYTAYNGLGYTSLVTDTMGRVSRFGYDGQGVLRWQQDPSGVVSVNFVDALGRITKTVTNYQDGSVAPNEPNDQDLITQQVYDRGGRLLRTIDAMDRVTVYTYDLLDRLVLVTENYASGACTWDPCNVQTQYKYDRLGNRTEVIDAKGSTRFFEYDALNQQTADLNSIHAPTRWEYNAGGQLIEQQDPRGDDYDLTYSYDLLGRLRTIFPKDPETANVLPISLQYNTRGQRTKLIDGTGITSYTYDALGRATTIKAPLSGNVTYAYDARGQRTQVTYPNNAATISYEYWPDGRLRYVKDPSVVASYTYEPNGRLSSIERANDLSTEVSYDQVGRVRTIEHLVDNTAVGSFEYEVNRLGLRTVVTETLTLSETATLPPPPPPTPLPLECTDPDLNTFSMQSGPGFVDDASVLLDYTGSWEALTDTLFADFHTMHRTNVAGDSVVLSFSGTRIAYIYSMGPNRGKALVCIDGIPVLDEAEDTYTINAYASQYRRGIVRTFMVDPGMHTIEIIALEDDKYIDIDGLSVEAAYGTAGTYDDRHPLVYSFEPTDWVEDNSSLFTGTISDTIIYSDEPYAFTRFTFYGTQVQLRYRSGPLRTDALITIDGKISDTLDQRFPVYQSGQAWTSPPLELGYHTINVMVSTYAQPDERVAIDGFTVINNPSSTPPATLPTLPLTTTRTISYSYDGLLRLISADASDGDDYAYSYDLAGNRTGVWVNGVRTETKTYNSVNEVVGWTYDDAGNLLDDGTSTYAYDALNRQILQDSTAQVYNGDGVLVQSGRTVYAQDLALPLTQVLQVSDGTNRTNYIYGHERLMSDAGEWYATDALGSVRLTLDANGTAYSGATYDPWGSPERGSVGTFGFTGELQQGDNVYLRARWYNATNGTFTSKDPFEGYPQQPYSLHPYQYGYSAPTTWTDPSGRCIPYIDSTCRPFWEEGVPYTGWSDFQQYSAGIVEGMGAPGAALANLTKQETWEAAGRGLDHLVNDPIGSASYLREELVDPVMRGAHLVWNDPGRAVKILNDNPQAVGQVFGGAASYTAGARAYIRGSSTTSVIRKPITSTSPIYLEYKALRLQGYTASEAYALIKQFRAGVNPNNQFVFHFTSSNGGVGIIHSCYLRVGSRQFRGPGVYAGTTPNPSWLLKHMPAPGWGLFGDYPVRIPIKVKPWMYIEYYNIPWRSSRIPMEPGSVLPLEP